MVFKKRYTIGSKTIEIHFDEDSASHLLKEELSLYELSSSIPDMVIKINQKKNYNARIFGRNPSIHENIDFGFRCHFGDSVISWRKKEKIYVDFIFGVGKSNIKEKYGNIQFTYPFECIGQVFHELALIPSLHFFSEDLTVIHGSALEDPKGNAIIITGTGGVGKTSIELELGLEKNYKFLSDDMSLLDSRGKVWPNNAFPKIYGYNTEVNEKIEEKIFKNRNILDKFQWIMRKKRGQRVRRRVNPYIFFDKRISQGAKISKLFILFRGSYKSLSIEKIPAERVAEMNIEVMRSEYQQFYKHLYWYKFNCLGSGQSPQFDLDKLLNDWQKLQNTIFSKISCYLIKIPVGYSTLQLDNDFIKILEEI